VVGSAQGVASLANGQLELMVNRAVLKASKSEPTSCANSTDNHLVTLHHLLMLGSGTSAVQAETRPPAAALANPVAIFVSPSASASTTGGGDGRSLGADCGISNGGAVAVAPLPPQLELLSLQMLPPGMNVTLIDDDATQYNASSAAANRSYPAPPVKNAVMLLRLRHLYALGEGDSKLGQPVSLDLAELFAPRWTVRTAVEMTADGVTPLAEREKSKLHWKQEPSVASAAVASASSHGDTKAAGVLSVTIHPMEIRTWAITVAVKAP
jgi:hypothetical protein